MTQCEKILCGGNRPVRLQLTWLDKTGRGGRLNYNKEGRLGMSKEMQPLAIS